MDGRKRLERKRKATERIQENRKENSVAYAEAGRVKEKRKHRNQRY